MNMLTCPSMGEAAGGPGILQHCSAWQTAGAYSEPCAFPLGLVKTPAPGWQGGDCMQLARLRATCRGDQQWMAKAATQYGGQHARRRFSKNEDASNKRMHNTRCREYGHGCNARFPVSVVTRPAALRGGAAPTPSIFGSRGGWPFVSRDTTAPATVKRPQAGQYLMSAMPGACMWMMGPAQIVAVPYVALLLLLYATQRSLMYPTPAATADPTTTGGNLIILPASAELVKCAARDQRAAGHRAANVAAVYFPAKGPDLPTLAYFHGNADQIGWGAAYIGREMSERYGFGFYGIEYPGYGISRGLEPSEESIYLGATQLLQHLTSPEGLNVPTNNVVLLGQSIGCAVALEMAARGFGSRMVLLAPFASILKMAQTAFPLFRPGLGLCPWLIRDKFNNIDKARHIRRRSFPILILHGSHDEIVPQEQGKALAAALGEARCCFAGIPGARHNNLFASEHEEMVLGNISLFASEKLTSEEELCEIEDAGVENIDAVVEEPQNAGSFVIFDC